MSDTLLFAYGCVVTLLAGYGSFLIVYTRFRGEWAQQNQIATRGGAADSKLARLAKPDVRETQRGDPGRV